MSVDPRKIIQFPGTVPADTSVAAEVSPGAGQSMSSEELSWELIGPVQGWGGTVLALIGTRTRTSESFYAGTTAGCFETTDHGDTWVPRNTGLTSPYVQALVASPHFERDHTLFAGTLGSGVMRSTNSGQSWAPIDFWQGPTAVTALAVGIDGSQDMVVLAGTPTGGIFRSSNGGRTFSSSNFGLKDLAVLALAVSPSFATDEIAFAVTNEGLHRSTNGGRAWRISERGLDSTAIQAIALSPRFQEDGVAFVASEDLGVFRSTDRGASWKLASEGLTNLSVNAVWVSPLFADDHTVFVGTAGNGVYRSTDGGLHWTPDTTAPLAEQAVMALVADDTGVNVFAGLHQGGVYRSADRGETWHQSSYGICARSMSTVVVSPVFETDHTLYVTGVEDGIVRSRDGGLTWSPINDGLPGSQVLALAIAPDFAETQTLHAVVSDGVFRSTDGGDTWLPSPVPGSEPRTAVYAQHTDGGCGVVVAFATSIAFSRDGGGIWETVATPAPDDDIIAVALSPNFLLDRTIVLTTFSATGATRRDRDRAPGARQQFRADTPQSTVTVWRSLDAGATWQPVIDQITTSRWVTTGFPSDYRGDRSTIRNGFFVGVGSLVQRPMWGGRQLWISERVGGHGSGVLSLSVSAGKVWERGVYAGTTDGVYRSDDEGLTWRAMSDGLHTRTVVAVALTSTFADGGDAFALTLGGTLHRLVSSHA